MKLSNNQQAFFAMVRAGLWEQDVQLSQYVNIDFNELYNMADEQSVMGLVTAGFDHIVDVKAPQEMVLQFVGTSLQIEQRNIEMNAFVTRLIDKLREGDVYAILVKGQGIAQCYERPLWRTSGDVDLLLSDSNYEKSKRFLIPLANSVEQEFSHIKHVGMTLESDFVVELHGTLHVLLSKRIDRIIDEIQRDVFYGGNVRSWMNGKTTVFLPSPDNDVIFLFTHILQHFYFEGIGLRQICDWCRLLRTYRTKLDLRLLESRIRKMGLMSEWKSFAAFAVDFLGMPKDVMPLYSDDKMWSRKADYIMGFVLKSGNFGHNRQKANGIVASAWFKIKDFIRHTKVFPWDSIKFLWHFVGNGLTRAVL